MPAATPTSGQSDDWRTCMQLMTASREGSPMRSACSGAARLTMCSLPNVAAPDAAHDHVPSELMYV